MSPATLHADAPSSRGIEERLLREHQDEIWRYLRFLGATRAEADDLLQDTFLAILRRPFRLHTRRETIAYLRTAAKRRLLMLRRQQGRRRDLAIPIEHLSAAEQAWSAAAGDDGLESYLEALRECLDGATQRIREVVDLQYRHRASRADIAARLKMSVEGVKSLLRRAKPQLRECIERKVSR